MPYVRLPNGITAHIRVAKPRRRRCVGNDGQHRCVTPAGYQCDYQVGPRKTCDAWICGRHALQVGPDLHHCPDHAHAQAGLFTGLL